MSPLKKGYIQVYTGDGKGKTTAALGLALRAVGAGLKVYVIQFMKGRRYSEMEALARLAPDIEILQTGRRKCIRKEEVTDADRRQAQLALVRAREILADARRDVLILDEILVAHWFGLVELDEILELMESKPAVMELVLTGRRAPAEVIARADLVTEMREIKHYYTAGVPARKGIES
jgi:cob(I)alamin adenosyltransferase